MALQIKKGDKLNINKAAEEAGNSNLSKLVAGAGWDPANAGADIDLDLVAILIGVDGKGLPDANGNGSNLDEAVCYFSNKQLPGLSHSGDNLTGEGEGDDEQITIDLNAIPAQADKVAIVIAAYSDVKFGDVKNAFVRIVDASNDGELVRYDLSENYGGTKGVLMGELSRNGSQWEFKAIGEARNGSDFSAVIESFGVF